MRLFDFLFKRSVQKPEKKQLEGRGFGWERYPREVEQFIEGLRDEADYEGKRHMVETFILGGAAAIQNVVPALKHPNPEVRDTAQSALVQAGEIAVEPLVQALKDRHVYVRTRAAKALGSICVRDPASSCWERLRAALRDEDVRVRCGAASSLGEIAGDRRALEALVEALKDGDRDVRWRAAVALDENFKWNPRTDSEKACYLVAIGTMTGKIRKPAVGPLMRCIPNEGSENVRRRVASALGSLGDERAIERLFSLWRYDLWAVVSSAAERAILKMGEPAIEPLLDLARETYEYLDNSIRNSVFAGVVQNSGFAAIAEIGEPAVARLVGILKSGDEEAGFRGQIALVLGMIGDKRALDALLEAMRHDNADIRWGAVRALGQMQDQRAVAPLIEALKDKDMHIRYTAAWLLGNLGDTSVIQALTEAMKDEERDVRAEAARALKKLKLEREK